LSSLVASVGNLLVVLAVFLDPNRDLRSPFNYFVANLGLTDLVVGLVTSPLAATSLISEGLKNPNEQLRVWLRMTYFTSCTASLLSLTALAVDRYVALAYPLLYRYKLNPIRALLVSFLVWTVSIAFSLIFFVVGYNKFRFVFANTAVAVTFAVLIFTNVKIFKHLRGQVKQWDTLPNSTNESLAMKQAARREKKVTKTLLIVLILFLACFLPSCVCIYIINLCSTCDCVFIHWVRDIQFVLVLANASVNPLVYAWRFERFRKAFKSILTFRACFKRWRAISVNNNRQMVTLSSTNFASLDTAAGRFNSSEIKTSNL